MTNATYKRRHMIGGLLTDSEGQSIVIKEAWWQAGAGEKMRVYI